MMDPSGSVPRTSRSSTLDVRTDLPDSQQYPFGESPVSQSTNLLSESPDEDQTPRASFFQTVPSSSDIHRGRSTLNARGSMQASARAQRVHSRPAASPHRESSWTLFGQLMENEGQLRTPALAKRVKTKKSTNALPRLQDDSFETGSVSHLSDLNALSISRSQEPLGVYDSPIPISTGDDDEDDSDSEASDTDDSFYTSPPSSQKPRWFSLHRLPTLSTPYRNVIKCAVAYFIGSLFTFSPYFSRFISDISITDYLNRVPSASAHMVATVTVYFHPARTMGGMLEANLYCLMGLVYSAFVCLSSMSLFWWFEYQPGLEWLGDAFVILWIALSMTGLAWMKVWMSKPSFTTACSMTCIIVFVVLVKEGGLETLLQVSFIVFVGAAISNIVCYLLWPQSATQNLQDNMIKTLDSFSTILRLLTSTFLLEEALHQPSQLKLQRAVEFHQSSFTSLKKSLEEVRSEWLFGDPANTDLGDSKSGARAYEDAVDSMNRLAQHLNGLRSGTRLQYELTKAHSDGKVVLRNRRQGKRGHGKEFSKGEGGVAGVGVNGKSRSMEPAELEEEGTRLLQAAAAMFGDLVEELGPPLRSLSNNCVTSLKRIRDAFATGRPNADRKNATKIEAQEFSKLIDGIEDALLTFDSISNQAVLRLYRRSEVMSDVGSRASLYSYMEDQAIMAGNDNEQVFVVYFFLFTMQEFARELVSLIDAMSRIYVVEQRRLARIAWWKNLFSKGLRVIGSWFRSSTERRPGLHRKLSAYVIPKARKNKPTFPKVRPHAPNTIQTPPRSNLTFIGRIKQSLWAFGDRLKERDLKHAVKVGMATAMLASPAFIDATRPIFTKYRGEWALLSFFVVMSPTIGATNFLGVQRVFWTVMGAATAAGVFSLFHDYPVVLALLGFLFALPGSYFVVVTPEYATSSRFVFLAYNLTCLFCYNLRQAEVSVVDIAVFRAVSVGVGVVWAALVSRFWWPSEARRELSKALGEYCLNLGWLYTRLVASNSFAPEIVDVHDDDDDSSPDQSHLSRRAATKLSNSIEEFMAMELHLQIKLIEIQGLLAQTVHEPRLKGPFPVELYRSILTSLQAILDKLHSMRCVTTREEWYTTVRQEFIIPVNKERHEMVGNIILYFSTLASAFRIKAPLPPYLPPAEKARQRLVDAIRRLNVVKNRNVTGSRQLLFFAYALTMQGVTKELDYLGRTLQNAFGVIGSSPEEFEALFREEMAVSKNIV